MSDDEIYGYAVPLLDVWLSIIEAATNVTGEVITLMDLIPPKLPVINILYDEDADIKPLYDMPSYYHPGPEEYYEIRYRDQKFVLWQHDLESLELE